MTTFFVYRNLYSIEYYKRAKDRETHTQTRETMTPTEILTSEQHNKERQRVAGARMQTWSTETEEVVGIVETRDSFLEYAVSLIADLTDIEREGSVLYLRSLYGVNTMKEFEAVWEEACEIVGEEVPNSIALPLTPHAKAVVATAVWLIENNA